MNACVMVGVGIVALIGGGLVLSMCRETITGTSEMSDEEKSTSDASDKRQEQFKKTGSYFPPDN